MLAAVLAFGMVSCDDYDTLILGSWTPQEISKIYSFSGFPEEMAEYNTSIANTDTIPEGEGNVLSFMENGALEVLFSDCREISTGTYSIKNDKLTMNQGGKPEVYNIDKLDTKLMTLSASETDSVMVEGHTVVLARIVRITLKKL